MILRLLRRADREAEGARLLSEYAPKGHLGFESPALRQFDLERTSTRASFFRKALACAARSAASKPTRYAGGVNRIYKTTLPPDTCDCSGRKGSETEGW